MACLDHECGKCGYTWMDNQRAQWCPQCQHWGVTNVFDEPLRDHYDDQRIPEDDLDDQPLTDHMDDDQDNAGDDDEDDAA